MSDTSHHHQPPPEESSLLSSSPRASVPSGGDAAADAGMWTAHVSPTVCRFFPPRGLSPEMNNTLVLLWYERLPRVELVLAGAARAINNCDGVREGKPECWQDEDSCSVPSSSDSLSDCIQSDTNFCDSLPDCIQSDMNSSRGKSFSFILHNIPTPHQITSFYTRPHVILNHFLCWSCTRPHYQSTNWFPPQWLLAPCTQSASCTRGCESLRPGIANMFSLFHIDPIVGFRRARMSIALH